MYNIYICMCLFMYVVCRYIYFLVCIYIYICILCKVVYFLFKEGTKNDIVINKQVCASWSFKKRHYFVFTKSLLKEAIKFLLHNCFFSIGNIMIIHIIGIPMGSDPGPFFPKLFFNPQRS